MKILKIRSNPLFIRTLDTGKWDGQVGIYSIKEIFGADKIVAEKKYRTPPIQIFVEPEPPREDLILLKDYFNFILGHFRNLTDSEFFNNL